MVAGYLSRTSSTLQIRGGWMLLTLSRINHTVALPDKHFVDDTDTGQDNDHVNVYQHPIFVRSGLLTSRRGVIGVSLRSLTRSLAGSLTRSLAGSLT